MIRVVIIASSRARESDLANVLAEDDRFEIVLNRADVAVVAGLQEIPETDAPAVVLSLNEPAFIGSVRAWLPPSASTAQIAAAITAAANHLSVLTPQQARDLVRRAPESAPIEALTRRELQVLRMLADGLENKEIAAELKISEHTAKFHVAQILAKLRASGRAEAVAIGIRRGLAPI